MLNKSADLDPVLNKRAIQILKRGTEDLFKIQESSTCTDHLRIESSFKTKRNSRKVVKNNKEQSNSFMINALRSSEHKKELLPSYQQINNAVSSRYISNFDPNLNPHEMTSETNEIGINSLAESMTENVTNFGKGIPISSLNSSGPFKLNFLIVKNQINSKQIIQDSASLDNNLNINTQRKKPFKLKNNNQADQDKGRIDTQSVQFSSIGQNYDLNSIQHSSKSIDKFIDQNTSRFQNQEISNEKNQQLPNSNENRQDQIKEAIIIDPYDLDAKIDISTPQQNGIKGQVNKYVEKTNNSTLKQLKKKKLDLKLDLIRNFQSVDKQYLMTKQKIIQKPIDSEKLSNICSQYTTERKQPKNFKIPLNNDVKNLQNIGLKFKNQFANAQNRVNSPEYYQQVYRSNHIQRPCTQGPQTVKGAESSNGYYSKLAQIHTNVQNQLANDDLSQASPYYLKGIGSPLYFPARKRSNGSNTIQQNSLPSRRTTSRLANPGKLLSPKNIERSNRSKREKNVRATQGSAGSSLSPVTDVQIRVRNERQKEQEYRQGLEAKNMELFRCSQLSYQQKMNQLRQQTETDNQSQMTYRDVVVGIPDQQVNKFSKYQDAKLHQLRKMRIPQQSFNLNVLKSSYHPISNQFNINKRYTVSSNQHYVPSKRNVSILVDSAEPSSNSRSSNNQKLKLNLHQNLNRPNQVNFKTQNDSISSFTRNDNSVLNQQQNKILRNSVIVKPFSQNPSFDSQSNHRLHHSIVINCPELKSPLSTGSMIQELSPLQVKRPIIIPQPISVLSPKQEQSDNSLRKNRQSSAVSQNQGVQTTLLTGQATPITQDDLMCDHSFMQGLVNLKMMRASISPPSREQKRQKFIDKYEEKLAYENKRNKTYQSKLKRKPQIVLPISHIHDSVRLSNFKHQIVQNNLIFSLKYPKTINPIDMQKQNRYGKSFCNDCKYLKHNFIQGRGITSHFQHRNFIDHQRRYMYSHESERSQNGRKSQDAQTNTLHIDLSPLNTMKSKNLDLHQTLKYQQMNGSGGLFEPDTGISNITMQFPPSPDQMRDFQKSQLATRNFADFNQYQSNKDSEPSNDSKDQNLNRYQIYDQNMNDKNFQNLLLTNQQIVSKVNTLYGNAPQYVKGFPTQNNTSSNPTPIVQNSPYRQSIQKAEMSIQEGLDDLIPKQIETLLLPPECNGNQNQNTNINQKMGINDGFQMFTPSRLSMRQTPHQIPMEEINENTHGVVQLVLDEKKAAIYDKYNLDWAQQKNGNNQINTDGENSNGFHIDNQTTSIFNMMNQQFTTFDPMQSNYKKKSNQFSINVNKQGNVKNFDQLGVKKSISEVDIDNSNKFERNVNRLSDQQIDMPAQQYQESITKKALSSILESSQVHFDSNFDSQMMKDERSPLINNDGQDPTPNTINSNEVIQRYQLEIQAIKNDRFPGDQSSFRLNNRQAISLSMQRGISSSQEANDEMNRNATNNAETYGDENGMQNGFLSEHGFEGTATPAKDYYMSAQYQNKQQGKSISSMANSDNVLKSKLSRKYKDQHL